MPAPASWNLEETRGDTWSFVANLKDETTGSPINITGRTYAMQVRPSTESTVLTAEYTCTVTNALNGRVECVCASSITKHVKPGQYRWDFQQTISGSPTTLVGGVLTCDGDVTK